MKKIIIVVLLALIAISACACDFGGNENSDCVRIHIRANSNDDCDQQVKLKVRDDVVEYLTPLLSECDSAEKAKKTIKAAIPSLTMVANNCLRENGYAYTAEVILTREEFPYRKYLNYSFPQGVYDALIVKLGEAKGDNWWCVCFPPLCFIPDGEEDENFKYKSKIKEIIEKYRG